jgi:plasmid stabilization system protein ParE
VSGYGNYLIFYLPLPDGGIDVLHVLHGARDFQPIIERG